MNSGNSQPLSSEAGVYPSSIPLTDSFADVDFSNDSLCGVTSCGASPLPTAFLRPESRYEKLCRERGEKLLATLAEDNTHRFPRHLLEVTEPSEDDSDVDANAESLCDVPAIPVPAPAPIPTTRQALLQPFNLVSSALLGIFAFASPAFGISFLPAFMPLSPEYTPADKKRSRIRRFSLAASLMLGAGACLTLNRHHFPESLLYNVELSPVRLKLPETSPVHP